MKICFIDDNWGTTLRMMQGIRDYYRKKCELEHINNDLSLSLLKVTLGTEDEEKKKYFTGRCSEEKFKYYICTSEEEIKDCIKQIKSNAKQDEIIFMIDILLKAGEAEFLKEEVEDRSNGDGLDKRILSMKCKDLLNANDTYYFYSAYAETPLAADWGRLYRAVYHKNEPMIFEREELMPQNFNRKYAERITGV